MPLDVFIHTVIPDDSIVDDMANSFQIEANKTYNAHRWSSIQHVFAISSILQIPIISVFPDVPYDLRPIIHRVVDPIRKVSPHSKLNLPSRQTSPVIMWSGQLDKVSGIFEPNHVVPLLKADYKRSSDQSVSSRPPKQANIRSFFTNLKSVKNKNKNKNFIDPQTKIHFK